VSRHSVATSQNGIANGDRPGGGEADFFPDAEVFVGRSWIPVNPGDAEILLSRERKISRAMTFFRPGLASLVKSIQKFGRFRTIPRRRRFFWPLKPPDSRARAPLDVTVLGL